MNFNLITHTAHMGIKPHALHKWIALHGARNGVPKFASTRAGRRIVLTFMFATFATADNDRNTHMATMHMRHASRNANVGTHSHTHNSRCVTPRRTSDDGVTEWGCFYDVFRSSMSLNRTRPSATANEYNMNQTVCVVRDAHRDL